MRIRKHLCCGCAMAPGIFPLSLMLVAVPVQGVEWPESPGPAKPLGPEVWTGAPIQGDSPCEILVRRVCGESRACAKQEACAEVQQTLERESRQRAATGKPGRMTTASGQCQEADGDRVRYRTCAK